MLGAAVSGNFVSHPFGASILASGNYITPYRFTGKEHDDEGDFEFDYFGARYYDSRTGSFTSIDKAGQFASGYVYGANNPIMGVDADGNFFLFTAPFLWGILEAGLISGGSYTAAALATGQELTWQGFGRAFAGGAIGAGVGGTIAGVAGRAANSFGAQFAINQASSVASSAALGNPITGRSFLSNATGSLAAYGVMGKYKPLGNNTRVNAAGEIFHGGFSGIIAGGVGAMTYNALNGDKVLGRNVGPAMAGGMMAGAAGGAMRVGLHGSMLAGPETEGEEAAIEDMERRTGIARPEFRSGGFMGLFRSRDVLGEYHGFLTGKAYIYKPQSRGTFLHESVHHWQWTKLGSIWAQCKQWKEDGTAASAYAPQVDRMFEANGWEPITDQYEYRYYTPGTMEWQAKFVENTYVY